jgi:hypothetical protein
MIPAKKSYWAVRLKDNRGWLQECDGVDWTDDLVGSGDIKHVEELWLFCPPNPWSPRGNTARIPIPVAGRAFQFKGASIDFSMAGNVIDKRVEYQIIGRIDEPKTQECVCFIYDYRLEMMFANYHTHLNTFGNWRAEFQRQYPAWIVPALMPIRNLSHKTLGLEFG